MSTSFWSANNYKTLFTCDVCLFEKNVLCSYAIYYDVCKTNNNILGLRQYQCNYETSTFSQHFLI